MNAPVPRSSLAPLRPCKAASGIVPKFNLSANESCLGLLPNPNNPTGTCLPDALRITIGTAAANEAVVATLKENP